MKVEELKIPSELKKHSKAKELHKVFSKLKQVGQEKHLQRVVIAKRPKTRQKRTIEIAELAAQKQPKPFS